MVDARSRFTPHDLMGDPAGFSAGRHHHHHLPAFEPWQLFNLCDGVKFGLNALQQFHAAFLVRHFPALKPQRHLNLVALVEEPTHRLGFDLIIVLVDAGPHLDFFNFDDLLFLLGFGFLLLLLVFELAVVKNLANGRLSAGGDFD